MKKIKLKEKISQASVLLFAGYMAKNSALMLPYFA
jgi:hypothetical protein